MKKEPFPADHPLGHFDSIAADPPAESFPILQLLGITVLNEQGDQLGRVADIVVDTTKDEVLRLHVVLSPRLAKVRIVAVPWSEFRFDYDSICLRIAESLVKVPKISRRMTADLDGGLYDNYRAIRFGNTWC